MKLSEIYKDVLDDITFNSFDYFRKLAFGKRGVTFIKKACKLAKHPIPNSKDLHYNKAGMACLGEVWGKIRHPKNKEVMLEIIISDMGVVYRTRTGNAFGQNIWIGGFQYTLNMEVFEKFEAEHFSKIIEKFVVS